MTRVSPGHYKMTVGRRTYEFVRYTRAETGERTHWNIRLEGGQYFDAGNTLEDCRAMVTQFEGGT